MIFQNELTTILTTSTSEGVREGSHISHLEVPNYKLEMLIYKVVILKV